MSQEQWSGGLSKQGTAPWCPCHCLRRGEPELHVMDEEAEAWEGKWAPWFGWFPGHSSDLGIVLGILWGLSTAMAVEMAKGGRKGQVALDFEESGDTEEKGER